MTCVQTRATACLVVAIWLGAAAASGQGKPDIRNELQAAYKGFYSAQKKKDIKAILGYMDPKFVHVSETGQTQDLAAFRKGIDLYCKTITAMDKFEVKLGEVKVSGTAATVTASTRTHTRMMDSKGSFGKKGKEIAIVMERSDRDTWNRTPNGWRWVRSEEAAPMKLTINGKPVPNR